MNTNQRNAVEEYTRVLRDRYPRHVRKIVLFGSQARGDAREGADVDVLVIVDQAARQLRNEITDLAFDIMLKYAVDLEPAIFSRDEWARLVALPTSFAYSVEQEGYEL